MDVMTVWRQRDVALIVAYDDLKDRSPMSVE